MHRHILPTDTTVPKKIFEFFSSFSKTYWLLILITLFRVYLAVKLPLYIRADAEYDDFLFVKYAASIIDGEWLGAFDASTLVKSASFPFFLATIYTLGIPYSFALISLYTAAILFFVYVMGKFIKNPRFLCVVYVFLLYSPVMFHEENVQRVYRGGLIVVFTIFTAAAFMLIFNHVRQNRKQLLPSLISAGIFLSFFWFLKEDSIWILPFVFTITFASAVAMLRQHKPRVKVLLLLLPFAMLFVSDLAYSAANYCHYGLFTINDRSGTNFRKVYNDLLTVDDPHKRWDIWITQDMLQKAVAASPSLNSVRHELDKIPTSWVADESGEVSADLIYWIMHEAFARAGIYDNPAKSEKFFQNVHNELQAAFDNGTLKKAGGDMIFISPIAGGYHASVVYSRCMENLPVELKLFAGYEKNRTAANSAKGAHGNIVLMSGITNSFMLWEDSGLLKQTADHTVNMITEIVKAYQKTGHIVAVAGGIGIILLFLRTLQDARRKKYELLPPSVIICGLMLSASCLAFGITWCYDWPQKFYDYFCGGIIIMNICEATGIYFLSFFLRQKFFSK